MKLDYKILWVDDQPKNVSAAMRHIETRLARLGFMLDAKWINQVPKGKTIKEHLTNPDYDLIVVDYDMGKDSESGDILIPSIRKYCGATAIVFYSAAPPKELRKIMLDKEELVDGLYITSRNDLSNELYDVVKTTIKKSMDINQMRGLILAVVADFDHDIDELILRSFNKIGSDQIKDSLKQTILEIASKFHEGELIRIRKLTNQNSIDEFCNLLSSDKKHEALQELLSNVNAVEIDRLCVELEKYRDDILVHRNRMAHAMQKEIKNGQYILFNKGKQFEYDDDFFQNLRIKLLEYRDRFGRLKGMLD